MGNIESRQSIQEDKPKCQYTWYYRKDGQQLHGECSRLATTKIVTNYHFGYRDWETILI